MSILVPVPSKQAAFADLQSQLSIPRVRNVDIPDKKIRWEDAKPRPSSCWRHSIEPHAQLRRLRRLVARYWMYTCIELPKRHVLSRREYHRLCRQFHRQFEHRRKSSSTIDGLRRARTPAKVQPIVFV